jgi:triacylglycerol esterase/lipase EstA (alpha/beta hydrolase family)
LVFVHGFVCNRAIWLPWMRRLRQRGRNYLSVNLEPLFGPLDSYLPAIDTAISTAERCSSAKPIVICHSMGGLVMRAWLAKSAESARRIERVITIGTPHHGTWLGRLSLAANGKQMGIGSRWLEQLKQAEQDLPMQGRPTIENWYSDTDNVVIPASSAVLLGSDDNHRLTAVGHLALIYHPKLLQRLEQL